MSNFRNIGLCAFIAASAAFVICFVSPGTASAVAIPKFLDYMKKGKRVEENNPVVVSKLGEIEKLLSEVDALRSENNQLVQEMQTDEAALGEEATRFEEAQKIFDEQVASVLSPELVAQVSQELESARQTFTATATFSDGSSSDVTDKMGALDGSFSSFQALLAEIKQQAGELDTAIKASWNLKENVK